uniref:Transcription initiation factor IIA subunit 2 n=1 Tax=Elaeophora elaphi TaxID=1147741 RepID=A0A158Q7W4_9BILA
MDENEMDDDENEELFDEEDIVRVIPLYDSINDSSEVSNVACGVSETKDEDMELAEDDIKDGNENFPNAIMEADNIISACRDEAFVVACFEDRWLAIGGKDDQAVLYSLQNLELVLRIDEHRDSVICAQFNVKGQLLATGDMSGLIVVSSTTDLRRCFSIDDCEELSWIQWHSSADILLAGGKNGVWMWLITTDTVRQTKVYICDSPATSVDAKLLSDGKQLLSCYEDGSVRLWSLKDEKSISIMTRAGSATCLDIHCSSPVAIIGDLMARCYFVNTETAKTLRIFTVVEGASQVAVECVKFCPGKEPWFVVGTNSGRLAVYDFSTSILRHILKDDTDPVVTCRWYVADSNEMYIISAGYSGMVEMWDSRSGLPLLVVQSQSIAAESSHLLSMDLSVKESTLYTSYSSGQLCKFSMSYQLYRSTTLGMALRSTLDEFVEDGTITPSLAQTVLTTFDKCINRALSQRVKNKVNFKADKLKAYRFCDNVWTFVMENVEFRDVTQPVDGVVDRVKIVACDAKN